MTAPSGNSEFCFPSTSMFASGNNESLEETNSLFPLWPVIKCLMIVHTCIYMLCNSRWESLETGNNLFVQTGAELLDHYPLDDPTLVECLCWGENAPSERMWMLRNSYCQASHSPANVINATRTITFVNNFGSVSVFVLVVKEAFDLPCLPQDYKDKIEISELV